MKTLTDAGTKMRGAYSTITLDLQAYTVPNMFTILNPNGNIIAQTGWIGTADYDGPWGSELYANSSEQITFEASMTGYYILQVETQTNEISDYWEAKIECAAPIGGDINALTNQEIINIYSNIGEAHNEGLDYMFDGLISYYGPVYHGGYSQAAKEQLFQKADQYISSYLTTQLSASQTDVNRVIDSIQNMPFSSFIGVSSAANMSTSWVYNSFSTQLRNAINQLDVLINDDSRRFNKAEYDLIINNNIATLPTNLEKVYLVSFSSVGYSSTHYWTNNKWKWESFFSLPPTGAGKDIAVADLSGVVWGGAGGCMLGALGGTVILPGIGTVSGCAGVGALGAVGGGLGSSGKRALEKFFEWLL